MHHEDDVDAKGDDHESDQGPRCLERIGVSVGVPARHFPEPDLDEFNHGKGEEDGAEDRAPGGECEHGTPYEPAAQPVDVRPLETVSVEVCLQGLRNEARQEVEGKGEDLIHDEFVVHGRLNIAFLVALEVDVARIGHGQAYEDCEGEY